MANKPFLLLGSLVMAILLGALQVACQQRTAATSHPAHETGSIDLTSSPVDHATQDLARLHVVGRHFVDSSGQVQRFWGVNLCAAYPTAAQAEPLADALADRGINVVRPHHLLRISRDWVDDLRGGSLITGGSDSQEADLEAWDRFDRFNAALRQRGIRLMFSAHWSRNFHPGDAKGDDPDALAWREAITELRGWHWKKQIDPMKMLVVFDERCAELALEFAVRLARHVNPYTGLSYGQDPQVLSWECINESSSTYTIICKNAFPRYFEDKLQAAWRSYAAEHGHDAGNVREGTDHAGRLARVQFLLDLDRRWIRRIREALKSCGVEAPVAYSNLWRGDAQLAMEQAESGYTENHSYADPRVGDRRDDFIRTVGRTALADHPFIVGEINQSETAAAIEESAHRPHMLLAAAAYGAFHEWSGVVWFAWSHGLRHVAGDGWSNREDRARHLGEMMSDGVLLDHLRSCSILYRDGLIAPSKDPITLWIAPPYERSDYGGLMAGRLQVGAGWQAIHGVRYAYGPEPLTSSHSAWLAPHSGKMVSDTGEIERDLNTGQLRIHAPGAVAISGPFTTGQRAMVGPLTVDGAGIVQVVVVAADQRPLAESRHLVISRTAMDSAGVSVAVPTLALDAMPADDWEAFVRRPRADNGKRLSLRREQGRLILDGDWNEADIRPRP